MRYIFKSNYELYKIFWFFYNSFALDHLHSLKS